MGRLSELLRNSTPANQASFGELSEPNEPEPEPEAKRPNPVVMEVGCRATEA